jgi:hypothetical protein
MTIRNCSIVVEYDDELVTGEFIHEHVAELEGVLVTGLDYDPDSPGTF